MARKHSIKKKETVDYNEKTGSFKITKEEEHLIVDDSPTPYEAPVSVLDDGDDDDLDLMFLGSKKNKSASGVDNFSDDDDFDAEAPVVIRVNEDGYW